MFFWARAQNGQRREHLLAKYGLGELPRIDAGYDEGYRWDEGEELHDVAPDIDLSKLVDLGERNKQFSYE
jgi:hypothetical protein